MAAAQLSNQTSSSIQLRHAPPKIDMAFYEQPPPTTNSPVYHIIVAAYNFRGVKKLRNWDWTRIEAMVEMVRSVRNELIKKGIIKNPVILFGDSVDRDSLHDLRRVGRSLGADFTDSEKEATHIVHLTNDPDDSDEEWFRTLEKKNGKVLLHWWYYPDSYDTWMVETAEHADPEPAPEHNGSWNVGARWLRDSKKFNEWMNEEDYEITEDRRLSAGEDQSYISDSETSPLHKRTYDYSDSPSFMDIDSHSGFTKRLRMKSPDPDPSPKHHRVSVIDVEGNGSNASFRPKKSEYEPLQTTDITNISQAIPNLPKVAEEQPLSISSKVEITGVSAEIENQKNETKATHKSPVNSKISAYIYYRDLLINWFNNITKLMFIRIMTCNKQEIAEVEMSEQEQNDTVADEAGFDSPAIMKEEEEAENIDSPVDSKIIDESIPENVSAGETASGGGVDPEIIAAHAEEEKKRIEEEARKYLSTQTQEVIIPSYAAWFDIAKIHEIERKSLPEFFNSKNKSKTPSIYKDYRDFIINTYRLNPSEYLTVTACRRNLAGDVCAIIRVHAFLEQWGLINYQVDPETRPSTVGPTFTGHYRITADTPRGLQPFQPSAIPSTPMNPQIAEASTSKSISATAAVASSGPAKVELNLGLRKNIYQSNIKSEETEVQENGKTTAPTDPASPDTKRRYNCFTCGVECSRTRYHNTKTKTLELCANCYLEGRFPVTMNSGDFIKMDDTPFNHAQESDWSDQETFKLLEALEMFEDDWNQIAEYVGTRTREQCILQFLQLPIEDPYLGTTMQDLGPLQYHRIPFSQADNPIMSVVAFLASVVSPGVAAAAANSSITEFKASRSKAINKEKNSVNVAATALGTAAVKAKALAEYEEREIQRLVNTVIESQLKKMELKLQQFEELEEILEEEKRELEIQRNQLYVERLNLRKTIITTQEQLKAVAAQDTGSFKAPISGHSYTNASNTRVLSLTEYGEEQEQQQSVFPPSQDDANEVMMSF
ncbi:7288_t:CDS:2 [Ambispora gerdemannii]|uniref:7288_t:CDS:1 n=1 Tax=Ambispora gerdemannii TaxID=144530 RepID=A0A9N8ZH89_9GLOM|nr:7288_t:CDS:2 [Ambispora gerdemannii]